MELTTDCSKPDSVRDSCGCVPVCGAPASDGSAREIHRSGAHEPEPLRRREGLSISKPNLWVSWSLGHRNLPEARVLCACCWAVPDLGVTLGVAILVAFQLGPQELTKTKLFILNQTPK